MIKIELEFATGAEARQALTELLGTKLNDISHFAIRDEKIAENFEPPKMEVVKEEKSAEEISTGTKKRRTKAQIEADEKATEGKHIQSEDEEPHADTPENKDAQSAIAEGAVTAVMLQEKAVNLIRNGKKELVVAIIKKFGGESISQADKTPLKPEVYAEVMDELNKL